MLSSTHSRSRCTSHRCKSLESTVLAQLLLCSTSVGEPAASAPVSNPAPCFSCPLLAGSRCFLQKAEQAAHRQAAGQEALLI